MFDDFTDGARKVMALAREQVIDHRHEYIGTEHMLLALARVREGVAAATLSDFGVSPETIARELEQLIPRGPGSAAGGRLPFTPRARAALESAAGYGERPGGRRIDTEDLLLGLLDDREGVAVQILRNLGVDPESLRRNLLRTRGKDPGTAPAAALAGGACEELDALGADLSAKAAAGRVDPVVGRRKEIERLWVILGRRVRNCPVLIGPPGVGKSAIVEGLAWAVSRREVPEPVRVSAIRSLDLPRLAFRDRESAEQAVNGFFVRAAERPGVVLFADDLFRRLLQPDPVRASVAEGVLARVLADDRHRLLVTARPDEFERVDDALGSMRRRFVPVTVPPMTDAETLEVLRGLRPVFERDYGVTCDDAALQACVALAARHLEDRAAPERAIDLLDETASRLRLPPAGGPADPQALRRDLAQADQAKDQAAARGDFESAARERERAAAIRDRIDAAVRHAPGAPPPRVDENAVLDTLRTLLGGRLSGV